MRLLPPAIMLLVFASAAGGGGSRTVAAHAVEVRVPPGWNRVAAADDWPVTDPRTLLVVGTTGVVAKSSACQIAAYRIPARGAVVVIVGWKTATSGGGLMKPGRRPLEGLTSVRRPSFECFTGRGAAASLVLGEKAYQVNVMVGDRAAAKRITQALAVSRSFRLAQ